MYTHDGTNRNNTETEDEDEENNRQGNDLPRHPYLKGYKVRIVAVMKNSMKPGIKDDDPEQDYIRDEDDLARAGGVTIFDRIEVQPWLEKEGRFSFVTSDPRAQDLTCFKHLAKGR